MFPSGSGHRSGPDPDLYSCFAWSSRLSGCGNLKPDPCRILNHLWAREGYFPGTYRLTIIGPYLKISAPSSPLPAQSHCWKDFQHGILNPEDPDLVEVTKREHFPESPPHFLSLDLVHYPFHTHNICDPPPPGQTLYALRCISNLTMSWQNKKQADRDKEVTTALDRTARKKRERILRKKLSSLTVFCGSLKTHKVKTHVKDDKKKPLRQTGHKEANQKELCCRQLERPKTMCPKCEIVTCRKCDTLHADSLFVAHSLLDHYDHQGDN